MIVSFCGWGRRLGTPRRVAFISTPVGVDGECRRGSWSMVCGVGAAPRALPCGSKNRSRSPDRGLADSRPPFAEEVMPAKAEDSSSEDDEPLGAKLTVPANPSRGCHQLPVWEVSPTLACRPPEDGRPNQQFTGSHPSTSCRSLDASHACKLCRTDALVPDSRECAAALCFFVIDDFIVLKNDVLLFH